MMSRSRSQGTEVTIVTGAFCMQPKSFFNARMTSMVLFCIFIRTCLLQFTGIKTIQNIT